MRTNLSRNVDTIEAAAEPQACRRRCRHHLLCGDEPGTREHDRRVLQRLQPGPQGEYQTDAAMAAKLWDVSTDAHAPYLLTLDAARSNPHESER